MSLYKKSDPNKLTVKQRKVYDYIKQEIKKRGFPPSIREICEALELTSTSTVHAHMETLQKKGYIRRSPYKNRTIEILEPDFYMTESDTVSVPIVGKVTAGAPILAVENVEDMFPVPTDFLFGKKDTFILRVSGDSMINKGIFDRDLILVSKQQTANNGEIVVAMIDDEATVKTFYKEKSHIRLQPENPEYEPIIAKNVEILGKVIGLFRRYK